VRVNHKNRQKTKKEKIKNNPKKDKIKDIPPGCTGENN